MKKIILNPIVLFFLGSMLGILVKILDFETTNLGNIFSELSIWIFLGVLIAIYSKNKKQAALSLFLFCLGSLITYYLTATFYNQSYQDKFIIGWFIFALFSPLLAVLTWYSKENTLISYFLRIGILIVTLLASIYLFDGLKIYDILIFILLVYFLFIKKIKR